MSEVSVVEKKIEVVEYNISGLDSIKSSSEYYNKIYDALHNASDYDTVNFFLCNHGGDCFSLIHLINQIYACKGEVHMHITGPCHSAGSTLALCGDSCSMYKNTYLMFHNYSSVIIGKGEESRLQEEETRAWIHKYFRDLHSPFLTDRELNKIEKDQDVYVHAWDRDVKKRFERHYEAKKK